MTTRNRIGTQWYAVFMILMALTVSSGGIASAATPQPGPIGGQLVYARTGVSRVQQANDRYACETYASDQTGFDPEKENGGISPRAASAKRADYFRAETACLKARGYTVK